MATNFPTTLDSYTTKVNNIDTIAASHINDPQDAIVAIETLLGASSQRGSTSYGSFTPAYSFGTTQPTGLTYTNQTGHFARFGGIVYFNLFIQVNAIGTGGAGSVTITGLPTAAVSASMSYYFPATPTVSWTTNQPTICRVNNNASTIGLFRNSATVAATAITYADLAASCSVAITGWYFHAAI